MLSLSLLFACGGNPNLPTQSKSNTGTLNATIGGAAHESLNTISLVSAGAVDMRGAGVLGHELHLHLAAGAIVGVNVLGGGLTTSFAEYDNGSIHWATDPLGNTGTITVTRRTTTHITGTFSFTMLPVDAANRNVTLAVTNGVFDVAL
ncbi:MAG: hypothetical protein M3Y64_00175 [Gemmatimonadota bacterium]|nr:hypothetical protein [Gemmatimonadota bacterium]